MSPRLQGKFGKYPDNDTIIDKTRALKRIKVKPNNKSKPLSNNDQKFIIFNI